MQNVSLVAFLLANTKAEFSAELTATTEVKLNKRGNPYTTVTKTKTTLVTINGDYQDAVNVQRVVESKQDDFTAMKPVWGENLTKSLVKHNENFYLQVIENGQRGKTEYHDQDGNELKYSDFERYVPSSSKSSRQDVNDDVIVKKYKIENINQLIIRTPLVLVFK